MLGISAEPFSKASTKGFLVKEDILSEPAPWVQESRIKELVNSADLFGEAYTKRSLVEEARLSDPVSNRSLSVYDSQRTSVTIQEILVALGWLDSMD